MHCCNFCQAKSEPLHNNTKGDKIPLKKQKSVSP